MTHDFVQAGRDLGRRRIVIVMLSADPHEVKARISELRSAATRGRVAVQDGESLLSQSPPKFNRFAPEYCLNRWMESALLSESRMAGVLGFTRTPTIGKWTSGKKLQRSCQAGRRGLKILRQDVRA